VSITIAYSRDKIPPFQGDLVVTNGQMYEDWAGVQTPITFEEIEKRLLLLGYVKDAEGVWR